MSAQLYTDFPRRHPLANNNMNNIPHRQPPPDDLAAYNLKHHPSAPALKHSLKPFPTLSKQPLNPPVKQQVVPANPNANPPSPPLPRQNAKVTPPSPPRVIIDLNRQFEFARLGLLGEGGFARVYEVQDRRGQTCACKVVTRASLKTKKAKTKLYAEIRIHKSLHHPNIVSFQDCFEDTSNVYMTLELCPNGSLMDLLRRRRRLSEPESRFFLLQLLGACAHMHSCQVIHRDLKLGNIFLDANMNVKVGDFGLAALIERPGERKKTICGTPNYIAPEVLFDTANGHSFEVDTWSIGVILYTLVVGRPPFQTKEVKEIYKRIRDNAYEFPTEPSRAVSNEVRTLVQLILTPDPQSRPALRAIARDPWFECGPVPSRVPVNARDGEPSFAHLSKPQWEANLKTLRKKAGLDEDDGDYDKEDDNENDVPGLGSGSDRERAREREKENVTKSLAQQEREFQRAVQPGSPISELLKTAKQPLMVSPRVSERERGRGVERERTAEVPLIRKLAAAQRERMREEEQRDEREREREEQRRKELESQKARIVAQMVPRAEEDGDDVGEEEDEEDVENLPPRERERPREREKEKEREREREREREKAYQTQRKPSASGAGTGMANRQPLASASCNSNSNLAAEASHPSGFEAAAQTLIAAFEAQKRGKVFRSSGEALPDAKVFIVSWVDYCNKYGMGYALTDGSVGVHFNDSTSMVLAPDKIHFDYISSRRQGSVYVRKNYTVSVYPEDLKSKVYLVKHFERYIMDRLYGEYEYTFTDTERTKGMDFVQKYLRMKQVIVFKMSSDVIQFNFYDHSKIILSSHGMLITHIDRHYALTRHTLTDIMAASLRPAPSPAAPTAEIEQAKTMQRLVEKVQYCRDVLVTIVNTAQGVGKPLGEGQAEEKEKDAEGASANVRTLASRASKMSLR